MIVLEDITDPDGIVLLASRRAKLLLLSDGAIVCRSPRGRLYPVDPEKLHLVSIYAVWLGTNVESVVRLVGGAPS